MTKTVGTRESIIWEEEEREAGSHHEKRGMLKILVLNAIGHK